jgi:hypothetical protein
MPGKKDPLLVEEKVLKIFPQFEKLDVFFQSYFLKKFDILPIITFKNFYFLNRKKKALKGHTKCRKQCIQYTASNI